MIPKFKHRFKAKANLKLHSCRIRGSIETIEDYSTCKAREWLKEAGHSKANPLGEEERVFYEA